jgi:hypothetical protein
MGERRQVPGGSDGAAAGNDRQEASVQTLEQELHRLDACAGIALGQRIGAKQHGRAHDFVGVRLADSAGVAAQEAKLELLRELGRDRLLDKAPKAGVDPVGVLAGRAPGGLLDQLPRGAHPPAPVLGEPGGHALDRDRPDVLDPEIVAVQEHGRGNRHREQV